MESNQPSRASERKEIEKYIKFFSLRTLQLVVQSRSGERAHTKSNANSMGVDWFNISIPNLKSASDIFEEVKRTYGKKVPGLHLPFCISIYLRPLDGRDMLMECWRIDYDATPDPSVKVCYTVYNRLAVLIKSVAILSRLLPCYRVCRKKNQDYTIYCKVSVDNQESQINSSVKKVVNVARIGTPFGSVSLRVHYRTRFELDFSLSPTTSSPSSLVHSMQDGVVLGGAQQRDESLSDSRQSVIDEIANAAVDIKQGAAVQPSILDLEPLPLSEPDNEFASNVVNVADKSAQLQSLAADTTCLAAFAPSADSHSALCTDLDDMPPLPSTPPFVSYLQEKIEASQTASSAIPTGQAIYGRQPMTDNDSKSSSSVEAVGFEDDFVLVELRPAFVSSGSDAASLYRQCQNPSTLDMFVQSETEDRGAFSISETLNIYSEDLYRFDEFYKNIECIDSLRE